MNLVNLERRLQGESMELKITRFGSIFAEKSMSKILVGNSIAKRKIIVKFYKI